MSTTHDPYAALRHPNFRFYAVGQFISIVGDQMMATVLGWELYERTHSYMALGLWGLVLAVPYLLFALPGGHLADRMNRKKLALIGYCLNILCALALAWISFHHTHLPFSDWSSGVNGQLGRLAQALEKHFHFTGSVESYSFTDPSVPFIYVLLFFFGLIQSFNMPTKSSLLPQLVPEQDFANAFTWGSQIFQIGSIIGPVFGGLLIFLGFPTVYLLAGGLWVLDFFIFLLIRYTHTASTKEPMTLKSLSAGAKFVWNTKIILATITMDLFAVFLGGAVALLPGFAKDILHVGAEGLGWLRAAPSIGALLIASTLTYLPPMRQAGKALLWAVAGFGLATIVFGLSQWFWLSWLMLFLTGAFDNISVVVRATLVQVLTPNSMRGRVSAVSFMFIVSSNELGAFESGVTAHIFGPVISVVAGGIGTLLVVLSVMALWPEVAKLGPLQKPLVDNAESDIFTGTPDETPTK